MVRNWESLFISLVIAFLALLLLMVVTLAAMLRQHRRFRRQMLLQAGEITHLSEEERKRVTPWLQHEFGMMDSLLERYYISSAGMHQQESLLRELHALIICYRTDKKWFENLREAVDAEAGGILGRTFAALPQLSERNRRLLVYLAAGLSNRSACVLLDEDLENYYRHKSRVKHLLAESGIPEAEEVLALFRR